jgi:hypothetical protein
LLECTIAALKSVFDKHQLNILSSSTCLVNSSQAISLPSSNTGTNTKTIKNKNRLTQCFDTISNTNAKAPNPYQEFDNYLNFEFSGNYYDNHNEDGDIGVFSYWREKHNQFPILSIIAEQIYAISASNTVIERLFSASKNLVSEKRQT